MSLPQGTGDYHRKTKNKTHLALLIVFLKLIYFNLEILVYSFEYILDQPPIYKRTYILILHTHHKYYSINVLSAVIFRYQCPLTGKTYHKNNLT